MCLLYLSSTSSEAQSEILLAKEQIDCANDKVGNNSQRLQSDKVSDKLFRKKSKENNEVEEDRTLNKILKRVNSNYLKIASTYDLLSTLAENQDRLINKVDMLRCELSELKDINSRQTGVANAKSSHPVDVDADICQYMPFGSIDEAEQFFKSDKYDFAQRHNLMRG